MEVFVAAYIVRMELWGTIEPDYAIIIKQTFV